MLVCRAEQSREAPSRASAGPLLFPHMTSARNPRDPILPCRPGWTLASPLRPHARNQRKALVRNPHVVGAARTPVSGARFSRKARAGARGAGRIPPWQGARRLERAGACKARVSSAPCLLPERFPASDSVVPAYDEKEVACSALVGVPLSAQHAYAAVTVELSTTAVPAEERRYADVGSAGATRWLRTGLGARASWAGEAEGANRAGTPVAARRARTRPGSRASR